MKAAGAQKDLCFFILAGKKRQNQNSFNENAPWI